MVKVSASQNTSQNLAMPCSFTRGIISSHTRRMYSARSALYSAGTRWAPMKVATRSMG